MKPYEFITMLCVVVATGLGVVTLVGNDIERVERDVDKLEKTVVAVDNRVAKLEGTVAAVDGRVTAVRDEVIRFKTEVENHAEQLAAVSNLRAGAFLAMKPGSEKALTYFQSWEPESPEADKAEALWAPYLDQLKQGGYNIETVTPSPFAPLQ
jgi:outer membrane murein-binding lipoprotein Lpp